MWSKSLQVCGCAALLSATVFLSYAAMTLASMDLVIRELPARLDNRLAVIGQDLNGQITEARKGILEQVVGARLDITGIARLADARTGQAIEITRDAAGKILDPNHGVLAIAERAESDADAQLGLANRTLTASTIPIGELARRFTLIPDQFSDDRRVNGLINQSMGLIAASKVTAGQAAKTAKVIADEAPKMGEHVEQITADITREADALTKPQSFWAQVRTWLLTIARIYGAV